MRIGIGDVRLFFDVEGAEFVPDGSEMRKKPTLCLMHGGPGFDHATLKPFFSRLSDIAQVIYYDHRGNGRSDRSEPGKWPLTQWADDFAALCRTLEIDRPIVFGQSFGGMVAQAFALRHPDGLAKLILSSTAGRMRFDRALEIFERLGGAEARAKAAAYFDEPVPENWEPYRDVCMPLYTREPDPEIVKRPVLNLDVLHHFFARDGEIRHFDFLGDLNQISCPTLVLAGDRDPITPVADAEDLVAALPGACVRFE